MFKTINGFEYGLNPLSAGRSFQTGYMPLIVLAPNVLIPYQQGGLFRRIP